MRYEVLEIIIGGNGILAPEKLPDLIKKVEQVLPVEQFAPEGIVISGRLPVWAYAALTHYLHPFAWVGTFEPRLLKAVVVASHVPDLKVGDVVEVDLTQKITVVI